MNEPPTVVLGLDLSLQGAGMVAVPAHWAGNWNRVAHHTFGESLPKNADDALRLGRCNRIADAVVDFARRQSVTVVMIEGYAFASRHGNAHSVGELGGIVRLKLLKELGLTPASVPIHSGRKLLMGKLPRKDAKIHVRAFLTEAGMPPSWTMDEGDAFVAANWAMAALGGCALATAPPVEEKRPRGRKAA